MDQRLVLSTDPRAKLPRTKKKLQPYKVGPKSQLSVGLKIPLDYRGEITNPSYQYNCKAIERLGFLIAV